MAPTGRRVSRVRRPRLERADDEAPRAPARSRPRGGARRGPRAVRGRGDRDAHGRRIRRGDGGGRGEGTRARGARRRAWCGARRRGRVRRPVDGRRHARVGGPRCRRRERAPERARNSRRGDRDERRGRCSGRPRAAQPWGKPAFPPRAPFFAEVHSSIAAGLPAGKAGLRPWWEAQSSTPRPDRRSVSPAAARRSARSRP